MNKKARIFILLCLGAGFAGFILIHLVLIRVYGEVIIYESSRIILIQEIITMAVIIAFYVRELREYA